MILSPSRENRTIRRMQILFQHTWTIVRTVQLTLLSYDDICLLLFPCSSCSLMSTELAQKIERLRSCLLKWECKVIHDGIEWIRIGSLHDSKSLSLCLYFFLFFSLQYLFFILAPIFLLSTAGLDFKSEVDKRCQKVIGEEETILVCVFSSCFFCVFIVVTLLSCLGCVCVLSRHYNTYMFWLNDWKTVCNQFSCFWKNSCDRLTEHLTDRTLR